MPKPTGGRGSNQYRTRPGDTTPTTRQDVGPVAESAADGFGFEDEMWLWAAQWTPPIDDQVIRDAVETAGRRERPRWFTDNEQWAQTLACWATDGWDMDEAAAWLSVSPFGEPDRVTHWTGSMAGIEPWEARQWRTAGFGPQATIDWCYAAAHPDAPMVAADEYVAGVCRWLQDGQITAKDLFDAPRSFIDDVSRFAMWQHEGWDAHDAWAVWTAQNADQSPMTGKTHHERPDYQWDHPTGLQPGDGIRLVSVRDDGSSSLVGDALLVEHVDVLPEQQIAVTVVDRRAGTAQMLTASGLHATNDPTADIDGYERRLVVLAADDWVLLRR